MRILLIYLLMLLGIPIGIYVSEELAGLWILIGLAAIFASKRPFVTAGEAVGSYAAFRIEPIITYLNALMALRRHKRVRRFLQLADDLRMRKQGLNRRLPRGPDS